MRFLNALLYISLFFLFKPLSAQVHTWTGAGNGLYWTDPLNWDQGTTPLLDGVGTVIIPTGETVISAQVVNFEYGEITGGGTLINEGPFNIINASEVQTSKIISNITFNNYNSFNIYKATGIINDDPLILNEGTHFFISPIGNITLDNVGIVTTTTHNPGYIEAIGPITKIGTEDAAIDVKLKLCCYDLNVEEGSLTIESRFGNLIQSPEIYISPGASLIFSGNNAFNSGASLDGMNEGYLEIKNNAIGNPIISSTYFFRVEGLLTINSATFSGGGTFRIQEADAIFTGIGDVTLDGVKIWVQSSTGTLTLGTGNSFSVNLINGGRISNGGEIFLNGANIIGTGSVEDKVSIGGVLNVINNSVSHQFNGINFWVTQTLNLNDGTILMDDNSFFENYFYQDPNFPEYMEFGEILGSGLFKFPAYNSATVSNNGVFNPSPGISTLNTINYSQTNTAKIFIDINGLTDYDIISNSGTTHFEGAFDVNLNFSPSIGDEFAVFISDANITNCQPVTTTSTTYNGLTYIFDVICNTSSIVLRLGTILNIPSFTEENLQFYAHPNPTEGLINFEYDIALLSDLKNSEAVIYNYLGQEVKQLPITSESFQVDISQLSNGVYFAKLISEKKVLAITKIVKK